MNVRTTRWLNVHHSRNVLIHLDLISVDVMQVISGTVLNVNVSE